MSDRQEDRALMVDKDRGVYEKFRVERIDDADRRHAECWYFVLDVVHDPLAREALAAYSKAARAAGYWRLADDLDERLARAEDQLAAERRIDELTVARLQEEVGEGGA